MQIEKPYAVLFKMEYLYVMLRAYIIERAPFPFSSVTVSAVVNAYMARNSINPFIMSDEMPPSFSGNGFELFGKYKNTEQESGVPEGSTAWFACKLTHIETEEDVAEFKKALDAMLHWMFATEYLIKDDLGYLPTQKLFDELGLKIKRGY
ncbi:hypothetical protein [Cronobacter muytjensii]|uniref:hypothetical protein n=1 Tax=Cronobacter muytjensii TaxID=413501 RepID=UPI00158815EB|nr:hypothetical protein [Cronobacter muytjensii]NUW61629.1 hypothetical protein [Cronobacter muytjensii]